MTQFSGVRRISLGGGGGGGLTLHACHDLCRARKRGGGGGGGGAPTLFPFLKILSQFPDIPDKE